jgi:hypothetical protein
LIRNVVTNSMAAGHPPAKMASLIREHIGLTEYQAQQVANYRADLETLNTTALQRELRDKRFDMPVARAIADGKPLSPGQVDRFTAQYHDNWLRLRASTIARTEALHAANMGGRLAIEQTIEDTAARRASMSSGPGSRPTTPAPAIATASWGREDNIPSLILSSAILKNPRF